MSFASQFKAGSDIAGELINTYQTAKRRKEFADIAAAQPDQQSTLTETNAPDPAQMVYDSDTGTYVPSLASIVAAQGTAPADAAAPFVSQIPEVAQRPTFDAKTTTKFLGKSYDQPLNEAGMISARQQAMAGVMDQYDPEAAMRYRQQATQGDLQAMQLKQAQRQGLREDKADANTALFEGVDKEVGAADLARRTNPDGTTRDMTLDDHLHNSMVRANLLTQKGKINEAGQAVKEYNAQSFAKIQLDTAQRDQDLGRAASALGNGDTSGIKDFYNKHVPDGAHVTNVTEDGKGNLTIERTTIDGRPLAPVTKSRNELLAGLASFKDPMALYNFSQQEFKNNLLTRAADTADKHLGVAQAQLGIANSANARAQTIFDTELPVHEANAAVAKLKTKLAETEDPKEQALLSEKIAALASGRRGFGAQHDPADVLKAKALVAQKIYTNEGEALDAIVSKPDKLYQSSVETIMKMNPDPKASIEGAKVLMKSYGWEKSSGGTWKRVGAGNTSKPVDQASAESQATAAMAKGATKEAVNKRLKDLGFAELK